MTDFDQRAAFWFTLSIGDGAGQTAIFQEVAGLAPELDNEQIAEGGVNRFVHRLPAAVRHHNLLLKRGIASTSNDVVKWLGDAMTGGLEQTLVFRDVVLTLRGGKGEPLRVWSMRGAYPLRWEIQDGFGAGDQIAIDVVELACNSIEHAG